MLIFGGTKFKEREPNENERSDMCFVLSVMPDGANYELQYLPGAKLRCPDKFFGNMQTRCDVNQNTVTVFGQQAAHRINTGKRDLAHLKWKQSKAEAGYDVMVERSQWKDLITE